jgi:hypothetical protein
MENDPWFCQKTRSGFERPFFYLAASGSIDDETNIACRPYDSDQPAAPAEGYGPRKTATRSLQTKSGTFMKAESPRAKKRDSEKTE